MWRFSFQLSTGLSQRSVIYKFVDCLHVFNIEYFLNLSTQHFRAQLFEIK